MIDILATIRAYLVQRPSVRALTEQRIWAGRNVPPKGYKPQDGPAITFLVRGGSPTYENDNYFASVQIKCYGYTEVSANELYRALYTELQYDEGVTATVRHVEFEGLGILMEEPGTEWIYVLAYVNFMVRERREY